MCKLFDEWSNDIEKYCVLNNLSFEKVKNLAQSWAPNKLALAYQDPDPTKGRLGLLDDTPMPLVLMITKENGKLIFLQTEHTRKYL